MERVIDASPARPAGSARRAQAQPLRRAGRDRTPYGMRSRTTCAPAIIERARAQSAITARDAQQIEAFNATAPILKKGLALTPVKFGISFTLTHLNQAGALVQSITDGSVHLNHGGTEMGQGLFIRSRRWSRRSSASALDRVQITATADGQGAQHVADGGLVRHGPQRHGRADRGRDDQGPALRLSRREVGTSRRDAGRVPRRPGVRRQSRDRASANSAEAAYRPRVQLSAAGSTRRRRSLGPGEGERRPFHYFAYGAACSEVAVDTLTGEMRVRRIDILHDVGRSLNPAIDIGQIEGGFVQGMGWLTTEELVYDDGGPAAAPMRLRPTRSLSRRTCPPISGSRSVRRREPGGYRSIAPRRSASRR